jgi:putative DNA primase/helicase
MKPSKTKNNKPVAKEEIERGENNLPAVDHPIYLEHGQAIISDGNRVRFNETAVAHKFVAQCQVSFDPEINQFLRYSCEPGTWNLITEKEVRGLMAKFLPGVACEYERPELSLKMTAGTIGSIVNMVGLIKKAPSQNNDSKALFPVANGVLDMTGTKAKLLEKSPQFGFRSSSPVAYDPNAKCERFISELLKPALSFDDISVLQRYLGSLLLGTNSAQRLLIMQGAAKSGKTTIVSIIEHVIGVDRTAYLRAQHLRGQFEFSGFHGKRLLCGKDVSKGTLSEKGSSVIKSLIGGDRMESETKYVAAKRKFIGDFHLIIHCNASLRIGLEGDEEAWRRRVLPIEFKKSAANPMADFAGVLLAKEGPGILNWLVDGAELHKQELKKLGNFELTAAQQARIDNMIDGSRSAEMFVRQKLKKAKGAMTVVNLTQSYNAFCCGKNWVPLSERQFHTELPALMLKLHNSLQSHNVVDEQLGKAARGYSGLALIK